MDTAMHWNLQAILPSACGFHQPLPGVLQSINAQLSLCIHKGLVLGHLWIPKSTGAQVPYMKWHSTANPLYLPAPCLQSQLTNLTLFNEEPANSSGHLYLGYAESGLCPLRLLITSLALHNSPCVLLFTFLTCFLNLVYSPYDTLILYIYLPTHSLSF